MTGLSLDEAYCGYAETDVLRGISISVEPGSCVAVLGPNGAGKSTLLRAVSGQLKIRSGKRLIDDQDATRWRAYKVARAGVRWVGEPRPVFPTLTVGENLEVGGLVFKGDLAKQRDKVFNLLPILKDRRSQRAGSLSGGQQQMLAIGQALMTEPRYLCLDEPSLGLAPTIVTIVAELARDLAAAGVGVLWAEQFPSVALAHCTHALVVSAGRVISSGAAAELDHAVLDAAYLGKRVVTETS
jgi:branched-chain amino acid transport system ATP-binding protein